MKTNRSIAIEGLNDETSKVSTLRYRNLPKLNDGELLKGFPEAKNIIPKKIAEWEEERKRIVGIIRNKLGEFRNITDDEFSYWFLREWVKVNEGERLLTIERHLMRLSRLLSVVQGRTIKGRLTECQIQQALDVPMEDLVRRRTTLRKGGRTLVGLCPFHKETHPSFHIYPETNSCWCFGCNQGGNTINLVRKLYGYSFKEAVMYLIGE